MKQTVVNNPAAASSEASLSSEPANTDSLSEISGPQIDSAALLEESQSSSNVFRGLFSRIRQQLILRQFKPEEQQKITERREVLSSLAYFIGKDFEMPVELNQPGAGWHWDFKNNVIRIDPKDLLEKPMDYLRCVISHEGGHRRISRVNFIPDETWQKPGFALMSNAIEDPRVNNFVANAYPKFKDHLEVAYSTELDIEKRNSSKADKEQGFVPRFMQAGFELIRRWYVERSGTDFPAEKLPAEVAAVVDRVQQHARESWSYYPSKEEADSGEKTISKYAQATYLINRDKIWPEFQKLVEQDLEDIKRQETLKKSIQANMPGLPLPSPMTGMSGDKSGDKGEEELSDQAAEKEADQQNSRNEGQAKSGKGQANGKAEEGQEAGGQPGESEATAEGSSSGGMPSPHSKKNTGKAKQQVQIDPAALNLPPELDCNLSDGESQELKQAMAEAISDYLNEEAKDDANQEPAVDLDRLPENIKTKISDYIKQLPVELQKELEQRAKAGLEKIEDQVNQDLGAKHNKLHESKKVDKTSGKSAKISGAGGVPSQEESDQAEFDKNDSGSEQSNVGGMPWGSTGTEPEPDVVPTALKPKAADYDEIKINQGQRQILQGDFATLMRKAVEADRGNYHNHRKQIVQIIDRLERELREIFEERRRGKWDERKRWGTSVEIRRRVTEVAEGISAPDTRSWRRKSAPKEQDYAISLVVDLSGSMAGAKIRETFKSLICLSEVLNRLKVPFEVIGFNNNLHEYKTYVKDLSPELREKMSNMIYIAEQHHSNGATLTGRGLDFASKRLEKAKADEKFIFVLTDGCPSSDRQEFVLEEVIRRINKQTKQKIVGLGIGPGTQEVANYFPNNLVVDDVEQMADRLSELLKDVILNYSRYSKKTKA